MVMHGYLGTDGFTDLGKKFKLQLKNLMVAH